MKNFRKSFHHFTGVPLSQRAGMVLMLLLLILALPLTVIFSRSQQDYRQHAAGANSVGQYEKFELTYPYSGNYSNPYDPSIVAVEAVFTSPAGKIQTVPGFYFQDYTRSGNAAQETLTPNGSPVWKVRFAPAEVGTYTYTVTLNDSGNKQTLGTGTFTSVASSNPGFVQTSGYHFQLADGQFLIPRGGNIFSFHSQDSQHPDAWGDGSYGVDNLISDYTANGANFAHVFLCAWLNGSTFSGQFAIACGNPTQYPQTLTTMDQKGSWDLDYFVNQAEQNHIYIMPILKLRDQPNVDPGDEIFDRYAVARWGYSPSIMAWDTYKEGATDPTKVGQYVTSLRSMDPYHHLISASEWNHYGTDGSRASDIAIYKSIFSAQGSGAMDIVQDHDYSQDCNSQLDNDTSLYPANLITSPQAPVNIRSYFQKPYWFGETGITPCSGGSGQSQYYTNDTQGLIFHGEVWGEFMTTSIAGSPWWYTFNNSGQKDLSSFKGISGFINQLPNGTIPDSAVPFAQINNADQVSSSDQRVQVIGRKNQTFAMMHVQNETGNWAAIVRDKQTPVPLSPTIVLHAMAPSTLFTVTWVDTTSGSPVRSQSITASATGDLTLAAPQITTDIAAIIKSGIADSPTPTPPAAPTPTPTSPTPTFVCEGSQNCAGTPTPTVFGASPTLTPVPTDTPILSRIPSASPIPPVSVSPTPVQKHTLFFSRFFSRILALLKKLLSLLARIFNLPSTRSGH